MKLLKIGYIISTHGIKGELKIKSNFPYKQKVFIKGANLYIGNEKHIEVINTYRVHKNLDMVTLSNYTNINEVLKYLKEDVYIDEELLELDSTQVLDKDLLEYIVICNGESGVITEIFNASKTNKVIRVVLNEKEILVPYNDAFIKKIDKKNKTIVIELLSNM